MKLNFWRSLLLVSPLQPISTALFRRFFTRHPLLGNAAMYGTMFVGAELVQQTLIKKVLVKHERKKPEPLDRAAIGRYCVLGYVIIPPLLYAWYKWLDWRFKGVSALVVAKKVILDVAVAGPIDVFIFFFSMALMEGKDDTMEEIRLKYVDTVLKQVYFWVPAQVVNFMFLPPSTRVAFVGVCSFLWINILCWVKRHEPGHIDDPPAAETSGDCAEPTKLGLEPTKLGLEPTKFGLEPTKLGLELTKLGLELTKLGLEPTKLGLEPTKLGLEPTKLSLEPTRLGLEPTRLGLEPTRLGLEPTRLGLEPTRLGLEPARLGLESARLSRRALPEVQEVAPLTGDVTNRR